MWPAGWHLQTLGSQPTIYAQKTPRSLHQIQHWRVYNRWSRVSLELNFLLGKCTLARHIEWRMQSPDLVKQKQESGKGGVGRLSIYKGDPPFPRPCGVGGHLSLPREPGLGVPLLHSHLMGFSLLHYCPRLSRVATNAMQCNAMPCHAMLAVPAYVVR